MLLVLALHHARNSRSRQNNKMFNFNLFIGICVNPFKEPIPLSPSPCPVPLHHTRTVSSLELEVTLVSFLWWFVFCVFFVHLSMDTACSQFVGFLVTNPCEQSRFSG